MSESRLYALILRSNKPEAKAFRKWVTSVVLPAIRKDGGYVKGEAIRRMDNLIMPKRTNEFQRLIYAIRTNLAAGAKVTESRLLRDRLTKRFREVDVCIESSVGGTPVMVCVECRDHARPADVGWVDAMKEKHARLPTSALVLATRNGFTPEALRVTAAYGIEAVCLEHLDDARFPALFGIESSLWQREATISIEKVRIDVQATGGLAPETVVCAPDTTLFDAKAGQIGPVSEIASALVQGEAANTYLMANAKPEHRWFEMTWEGPRDHAGDRLFLQKIEPLCFRQIAAIRISGPVACSITTFNVRRHEFGGVKVVWAPTVVSGKPAMFVATRAPDGKELLALHVAGSHVTPTAPPRATSGPDTGSPPPHP